MKLKILRTEYKAFLISGVLLFVVGCNQPSKLEKVYEFKTYASGSGMVYYNKKIFLIGDDMPYILVTDTTTRERDRILLIEGQGRIPKDKKQDLEAAGLLRMKKKPFMLLLGSGSVAPARSKGWLVNLESSEKRLLDLEPFYNRLQSRGIPQVNIEGLATVQGGVILANRGNKSSPKNFLVFTSADFYDNQQSADIRTIKLGSNTDTASFSGVSGLDYSYKSDRLFLTVSTENTYSTSADGAIGKSYLWIIDNISTKRRLTAINASRIIDLESVDQRFTGHKVESVCILSETRTKYKLALVADDDKGTSVMFIMSLNKK